MERSVFFDLACENGRGDGEEGKESQIWRSPRGSFVLRKGENTTHGNYAVFFTEPLWQLNDDCFFELLEGISGELSMLLSRARSPKNSTLLIAGLGNAAMTADALGAEVVGRVTVTRKLYEANSSVRIAAVATGVLGTTGIETYEHLRALCEVIRPFAVIAVDALSAKTRERLGATVQISTGGISPGAGVGNSQKRLSENTLGIPVITLGVPTVIHSSAIVREAFETIGVEHWESAKNFLAEDGGLFVMPKESDLLLRSASLLLSSAIDRACRTLAEFSHISGAD